LGYDPHNSLIAIGGLARRPPKADTPDEFWSLLRQGADAITPVPEDRPDACPPDDAMAGPTRGGYLRQVDHFDARCFGVSPRGAAAMDPRQRLPRELGWEVCEDAHVAPDRLKGAPAGVFVGVCGHDYATLLRKQGGSLICAVNCAALSQGRPG
jgi:acyl transferase domain-containing protein